MAVKIIYPLIEAAIDPSKIPPIKSHIPQDDAIVIPPMKAAKTAIIPSQPPIA